MKAIGEKRSLAVLLVMIAGYVAFFAFASVFRYRQFLFQNFDLAIGNQILWNLLHGSMECTIRGGNFFGDHFRPVFFLYLPLYAVRPDPRTLLFLQSVILGCGAIPLYGVARDRLGARFGLLFAAIYLFNPLVGYINLFEFHPEVAVAPLLLGAIYYFYRDRLRPFALCVLLSLMCKENISFIVFTLGFWALWHRKRWPWYLATFGAGAAWAVLSFMIVIPYFNAGAYPYVQLYGYLGRSAGAIVKTCVTRPLYILSIVCVYPNLRYMFDVFVQFGFLPLLSPLTLLPAMPPLLQILLSHARGVPEIYTHYGAKLLPFLFAGSVAAVSWWCRVLKRRWVRVFFGVYLSVFAIAANVRYGPHLYLPLKWSETAQPETAAMKRALVEKVSPGASAVATFDFLPALSGRRELYSFHYLYWGYDQLTGKAFELPDSARTALLDFNDFNIFWAIYSPHGDENMRAFLVGGKWLVVAGSDSSFLFEKNPPEG
ncbi:MAG TPA: DUF2079 domain-containing protein, partial [bacterium]|nr:DUF2079 domain-containing protein [bacterium]